ncbi:hypothetical protein D3C77_399030 [compost metagenome]
MFKQANDKALFLKQIEEAAFKHPYNIQDSGLTVVISFKETQRENAKQILNIMQQSDILPISFNQEEASLEDIFLEVIQ